MQTDHYRSPEFDDTSALDKLTEWVTSKDAALDIARENVRAVRSALEQVVDGEWDDAPMSDDVSWQTVKRRAWDAAVAAIIELEKAEKSLSAAITRLEQR
jgi:hypothetical protein